MRFALLLAMVCAITPCMAAGVAPARPMVFIYGAQSPEAIEQAAELGVNCVYLDLTQENTLNLDPLDERIAYASELGLGVIIAIPTLQHTFNLPSPLGQEYREWVTEQIESTIEHFKDNSNVIAWATEGFPEWEVDYTSTDFREYLKAWYPDVPTLNASWGSGFSNWSEVSIDGARELDASQPFGVGRASIDVAEYRRLAYHDIMALWAKTIKGLDASRPLMTGPVMLYRSLTAIPAEYDIVCPFMPPDELEPDRLTHNMHGVDMARRCGRFSVIPWLRIPQGQVSTGSLASWIAQAGLHGARGVGLHSWWGMEESVAPHLAKREVADALAMTRPVDTMDVTPRPTIAFLYAPYAGGLSTKDCAPKPKSGAPRVKPTPLQAQDLPAYGYIEGLPPGEPNNPFASFRIGTQYGIADYITTQDAGSVDLNQYATIMAPMALRLSERLQTRLVDFTRGGGALVLDIGAGVYQTGSWLALPPALAELCGIEKLTDMYEVVGELTTTSWRPDFFPSLRSGVKSQGSYNAGLKSGTPEQLRDYHVFGPACYAVPSAEGGAVATLNTKPVRGKPLVSGLFARSAGLGFACYASHRLWANWRGDDPLYAAFHNDLCLRKPTVELLGAPFWTTGVCATLTDDGIALCNAGKGVTRAEAICLDAGHALYTDAACLFSASARSSDGTRSGAARVSVSLPPGSVVHCRRLPMLVQPYTDTCWARPVLVSRDRLVVEAAGDGGDALLDKAGALTLSTGGPTRVRYTVRDGVYKVAPGSTHRVSLDTGKELLEGQFTANADGQFRFSETVERGLLTITPVQGKPAVPER